MTAAPLAPRIVEKGLVSDRIVIDTLIQKYSDHFHCIGRARCWSERRHRDQRARWTVG